MRIVQEYVRQREMAKDWVGEEREEEGLGDCRFLNGSQRVKA